ncbi:hypothetical protein N7495_007432 [Penicillium taxi]|uniref:uncharacterized protein n=1 Tax=Penicillium taxi TaxID=168475 RepID=UPI00254539FA|nr:uncharacterized protein N7495_007432 [Penicillium taxi]KAJ5887391.1 hypothetical protein N7495_007432 [Penicillium taxi]
MNPVHAAPTEVIFPVNTSSQYQESCIFHYGCGPVKFGLPRKRGRPKRAASSELARNETECGSEITTANQLDKVDFIAISGNSKLDAKSRKVIRSRVMVNYRRTQRQERLGYYSRSKNSIQQIPGVDPFNAFPVRLESYALELLSYYSTNGWKTFYSIEKHSAFNLMTDYWFSLAFTDAAFFHTLISCAQSHFEEEINDSLSKTILHLNAAISIINERLNTPQYVTNGTLIVVATVAIIELCQI